MKEEEGMTMHERVIKQLIGENPDWCEGDLRQVVVSVSPYMSDEGRKMQLRYRSLMGLS